MAGFKKSLGTVITARVYFYTNYTNCTNYHPENARVEFYFFFPSPTLRLEFKSTQIELTRIVVTCLRHVAAPHSCGVYRFVLIIHFEGWLYERNIVFSEYNSTEVSFFFFEFVQFV